MRSIIINILHSLAHSVIAKYHPKVVGITGSVGKTATKEAVFSILARKFRVRSNTGNYNTEVGLPLAILGVEKEPGRSPFKWLGVLLRGIRLIVWNIKYPEILVLEMGADKPGDIKQLLEVIHPTIGIITGISPVHTEQFGSIGGVEREKGRLFRAIDRHGWIIVNNDDKAVVRIASASRAQKVGYGIKNTDNAQVKASEISVSRSNKVATGIRGLSFKLITNGTVIPVLLKGVLGEHQVYSALAASAVAQILGVNMDDIAEGIRKAKMQPGRMRVIEGIKHTTIIDDTYNASPIAMRRALETVGKLESDGKTYAVLGDMLELGGISEAEHKKVGALTARLNIGVLIVVGERSRDIARAARKEGMGRDYIFEFSNTREAGLFLQQRIEQGDLVLIKGSRGMHMENIVKEVMAHPEQANELLVH